MLDALIRRKFPGMPLYLAENGRIGVELFEAHAPEIVITDIIMPEMDGVEMAIAISSLKPDTKFIVVSGYNTPGYLEQFSKIGSKFFLKKPIIFKELFAAIEDCIAELNVQ
jgi:YesN/AraC family two-component response regulator